MNISVVDYKTPFGELILGSYEEKLCLCDWKYRKMRDSVDQRLQKGLNASMKEDSSDTIEATKIQLSEYLAGQRKQFTIPTLFVGTDFQKEVWEALLKIPFGKTASYLELSNQLGNPKAIRAVASANGANALSILVPCHRIIGSNDELTGYAGGLDAKKKLLELEGSLKTDQLNLF